VITKEFHFTGIAVVKCPAHGSILPENNV
jgi:hypothetical protein